MNFSAFQGLTNRLNAFQYKAESDDSVQANENKEAAPETDTDTDTTEFKEEGVTEAEESGNMDISPDECAAEIDQLLISEAVHPSDSEILAQMADYVTFARVLNDEGVIFTGIYDDTCVSEILVY